MNMRDQKDKIGKLTSSYKNILNDKNYTIKYINKDNVQLHN